MGHPNGRKPARPPAHSSSGKFDKGCAVAALAMFGGIVSVVVGIGYGVTALIS